MRFKISNKGSPVSTIFGISDMKEKAFERSVICIQEEGKIYKVVSVGSNKDGSIYAFFNYCKEKKASIIRHSHTYRGGRQEIDQSQITHEFVVDGTAKLSIHRSGFVHISGNKILSGIDQKTGKAKGVGVFSSPLENPVSSGPTFGFSFWGISKGFELLGTRKPGVQYIILNKENSDFTPRYIEKNKPLNSYILEFFIFPKPANKFVFDYKGNPYINHRAENYLHDPGAMFAHPVLDLEFFDGVISVFPGLQWSGFAEKSAFGYSMGSPGGSDTPNDNIKTGYNFQLVCMADISLPSLMNDDKPVRSLNIDQSPNTLP